MTSLNVPLQDLRCPLTGSVLEPISPAMWRHVQERLTTSGLYTRQGIRVNESIHEGLVNADRTWIYPVVNGVPQMMIDEALAWGENESK